MLCGDALILPGHIRDCTTQTRHHAGAECPGGGQAARPGRRQARSTGPEAGRTRVTQRDGDIGRQGEGGSEGGDGGALPGFAAEVFAAAELWVVAGANQGDGMDAPDLAEPGDIYRLEAEAAPIRLVLGPAGDGGGPRLRPGSRIGAPGDAIEALSRMTLMAPDGDQVELLVLRHAPSDTRLVLPLSPLGPRIDYTLISVAPPPEDVPLADVLCASFQRGTRITLADGAQRPIEALLPGDRVLTRDSGPQPVRWVGKARLRALGAFAPVVIAEGVLGNAGELAVSPHHRIFLYQRGGQRLGSSAELMVQAKHLVDGERIARREGGFVDYYSLVFDRHEIVYAEGIPCESLLVSEATLGVLPQDLSEEVRGRFPGLSQRAHFAPEAGRELIDAAAREALLARGRRGPREAD